MKTVLILWCFAFFSCASSDFRKKDRLEIDKKLKVAIENQPISDGNEFLQLFEISQTATDVKITFNDSGSLEITYADSNFKELQQKIFKGEFRRKYYEIYLEKKRTVFPPIYWVVQVRRLRLALRTDEAIVVEKHYDHSGMILFLGAGSSYTSYNKYPIVSSQK